ncbi:MAG: methyltransferase domain-containing protein [Candidatus Spechtbacterales bacterium]
MDSYNKKTLRSYEENLDEYITGTPQDVSPELKKWINDALGSLPEKASILEIGSGFGRDAKYLEELGHSVLRTDASLSFVHYLQNEGYDAMVLNVLKDVIPREFDMVFANAVFLHFKPKDLSCALSKACNSLDKNGVLAFTVKHGEGSEWSRDKLNAPRFFQYWRISELALLVRRAGFKDVLAYFDPPKRWIYVIAKNKATKGGPDDNR